MDQISKVTVEFHDPSGVFPLISSQLQSRLPLRNLHWKSTNRPLRSIDFLHVDLVQDVESRPQSRHSVSTAGQVSATPGLVKERRHQIPGLRTTPYLKVYLLRCDDAESYRETCRKSIREWLKAHTPSSQKSSSTAQENHDAFEWMILHVVIPNTFAAGQPGYSSSDSKNEAGASEKSGSTSRLKLGRSSNTILEKIKADFNVSGKSAPDRVAQVRLEAGDVPQHPISNKPSPESAYSETPQDRQNAWNDTMTKFKILILSSFDLRVRQYEDDIRERSSQRTLPGWNFCTFFVLKEGLARGFESVGLLDDALLGYDELSAEFDSVIRDQGASAGFLSYTESLQPLLVVQSSSQSAQKALWNSGDPMISSIQKPYRELILANNISTFDFLCYVFARQKDILLRMGILHSSELESIRQEKQSVGLPPLEDQDMSSLSELCRRTSTFITSVARVLRDDLVHLAKAHSITETDPLIGNVVASWTYGVAYQLIKETDASTLNARIATLSSSFEPLTPAPKPKPKAHPVRTSSLSGRSIPLEEPYNPKLEEAKPPFSILGEGESSNSVEPKEPYGALEELARNRAGLYMVQRQILGRFASQKVWSVGLMALLDLERPVAEMEEINLEDDGEPTVNREQLDKKEKDNPRQGDLPGTCVASLLESTLSIEQCRSERKTLTMQAIGHFLAARSPNAVEHLMADLAMLHFQDGDFTAAASLLGHITSLYTERQWTLIETQLLRIHAECLRRLHRRDDHVRLLLTMLGKSFSQCKAMYERRFGRGSPKELRFEDHNIDDKGLIAELLAHSTELPYEIEVPMSAYFADIAVDPYIRHLPSTDGFQIRLKMRHLLKEAIVFRQAKVLLKPAILGASQEFWIESDELIRLEPGLTAIVLSSHVNTYGIFHVEKAALTAGNITFVHDRFYTSDREESSISSGVPKEKKLRILCYPRSDAFNASITHCRSIHIEKARSIDVACQTGLNKIEKVQLRMKSASAGLRIRTADAQLIEGKARLNTRSEPGIIEIFEVELSSSIVFRVPYGLDSDHSDISVRLSVTYETPDGIFEFFSIETIPVALQLDVNVHDLFKSKLLFSKFNVRSSTTKPIELVDMQLQGTDAFEVESPPCQLMPMLIFPQQPAPLVYKITPRLNQTASLQYRKPAAQEQPLTLEVQYKGFEGLVLDNTRTRLLDALVTTDLKQMARLLELELAARLRQVLTAADFVELALMHELDMPSFSTFGWSSLLDLLPGSLRAALHKWLLRWHHENPKIVLEECTEGAPTNTLILTVPIPRLHILHTVSLSLPNPGSFYASGSMISATLSLSYTRRWDSPAAVERHVQASDTLEFILEIDAPSDVWLLGGIRRIRFSAQEDETVSFPVMLVPLKAGRLLLPSVDVRMANRDADEVGCVTDYKNMGDTVLVINDVGSSTVSLKEGLHGTEALLVGLERR